MQIDQLTQPGRRLVIISFTEPGTRLGERLCEEIEGYCCESYGPERFVKKAGPLPGNVKAWIASRWGKEGFLFIGAAGIAVRMIAPCVKDKYSDSAVLVMDEKGQYVIPLLSGHAGGAVELAKRISCYTGAVPVITTATDVQGKFAVDVFADRNKLIFRDRKLAAGISAAVLEGKRIGFWMSPDCSGWIQDMPEVFRQYGELCPCREYAELRNYAYGIAVSQTETEGENVLCLQPGNVVIGIGCRKNTDQTVLEQGIRETLAEHGMIPEQTAAIVSITLKAEEPGMISLSRKWRVPFITYPPEELAEAGPVSESSEFVRRVTGVDNVCERAVKCFLQGKRSGRMLQEKKSLEGMTIAIGVWT